MARIALAALAAAVLVVGLALPAAAAPSAQATVGVPAAAVTSSVVLAGLCGAPYRHVGHYPMRQGAKTLAHLDVYWSWTSRRNCLVVNHAGPTYGVELYTEAKIRPSGEEWPECPGSDGCDGGFYRFHAGPVYTPADVDMTGRCIDVGGVIDWTTRTMDRIHCG